MKKENKKNEKNTDRQSLCGSVDINVLYRCMVEVIFRIAMDSYFCGDMKTIMLLANLLVLLTL